MRACACVREELNLLTLFKRISNFSGPTREALKINHINVPRLRRQSVKPITHVSGSYQLHYKLVYVNDNDLPYR